MYREELVAVNYNPNDRNLTNMLNQLEIPYIFNKTQPNIYDHIHWALLQCKFIFFWKGGQKNFGGQTFAPKTLMFSENSENLGYICRFDYTSIRSL